jgi:HlyD family secretion protein
MSRSQAFQFLKPLARCCVLLGTLLPLGCGHKESAAPAARPEPEVQVTKPERRTITRRVGQPAFVNAYEQTAMYPKIAGYIQAWSVDIGDRIQKDQVLADLFVPELESQYQEKQAELARDEVLIEVAQQLVDVAQSRLQAAAADVERSKADVENYQSAVDRWESEVKRLTGMVAQGVIAKQILEESQKQLKSNLAMRDAALANVESIQADEASRRADLGKARADVDAARARTKVSEAVERRYAALVSYMKLTSPYDGVVVIRNANTGDFVQPASGDKSNDRDTMQRSAGRAEPIYVVARVDLVRIFVDVPEMYANYVREGTEAHVRLQALDDEEFPGKVARTSWSLNVQTRTLRAEIDLENPDARILPGMYAYAEVLITRSKVMTIPLAATMELGNQNCCFLLVDGKAIKTPIETGLNDGKSVEVFKKQVKDEWVEFDGQEQVVMGDLTEISGGQKVKVETKSGSESEPPSVK